MEAVGDDPDTREEAAGHCPVGSPEVLGEGLDAVVVCPEIQLDLAVLPGFQDVQDLPGVRVHDDELVVRMLLLRETDLVHGEVPHLRPVHHGLDKAGLVKVVDEVADGDLVEPGHSGIRDGLPEASDHGGDETVGLLVPSGTREKTLRGAGSAVRAVVHLAAELQDDVLVVVAGKGGVGRPVLLELADDLPAVLASAFPGHGNPLEADIVLVLEGSRNPHLVDDWGHLALGCGMTAQSGFEIRFDCAIILHGVNP